MKFTDANGKRVLGCDFCGKTQDFVELLFNGPEDHCICSECVDAAVELRARHEIAKRPIQDLEG